MQDRDPNSTQGVLICANPFSGAGPNRQRVETLVSELSRRGLEPRLMWGLDERRAALADPGLADWCRCVVVAGGDGSIGAVVNELGRAGALAGGGGDTGADGPGGGAVAMATLPIGNENLFAKHYGFTGEVPALADAIHAGRTRRVDLGRVIHRGEEGEMSGGARGDSGGQLFTLMAGVGFDAEVVHRMDRWRSGKGGGLKRVRRASYVPRVVSTTWGYGYPRLNVEVDGQAVSGTHLFVFNLPEYGGGLGIAPPGCRGDDGKLDWVMFDRPGVVPLLGYAWSVLRGGHLGRRDVMHGQADRLLIRSVSEAPVQVDGDPAGRLPIELAVDGDRHLELLIT